jgi:hypothetical protein
MASARSLAIGLLALAATASTSCFDPVHADEVEALGPEASGVREGPTHRPGQPCRVCHGGDGPGSPELTFAGTVYLYRDQPQPAVGTRIEIREVGDETKKVTAVSNEVGNFYVTKEQFNPQFPVFVTLLDDKITDVPVGIKDMVTPIGRNGGCGFCHANDYASADRKKLMPHVYLNLAPPKQP